MEQLKRNLLELANDYVNHRIKLIHDHIGDLKEALKLETKCSMGDKYETDRAMLHLEFEKLSGQIEQYERLLKTLDKINPNIHHKTIQFGSLVQSSGANYFISIPAGILKNNAGEFYAVGYQTPVARQLLGKKEGDEFSINNQTYEIQSVI